MLPDILRYYCDRKERDKMSIVLLPRKYFFTNYLFVKSTKFQIKHHVLGTQKHHIMISALICDLSDHTLDREDFCSKKPKPPQTKKTPKKCL